MMRSAFCFSDTHPVKNVNVITNIKMGFSTLKYILKVGMFFEKKLFTFDQLNRRAINPKISGSDNQ